MGNVKKVLKSNTKDKKYKSYIIKVTIKNTHPPVWRRLQIPAGITFHELNAIIQLAFNWCGYHLYSFEIGDREDEDYVLIETPNDLLYDFNFKVINSTKTKIDKYFDKIKKLKYTYDFGDNWIHDIQIENVVESEEKLKNPVCLKAKMASLPEDCGGPWGYEDLLNVINNPKDERYQDMKDWLEQGYSVWYDDRTYVDLDEINMELEAYKDHAEFILGEDDL